MSDVVREPMHHLVNILCFTWFFGVHYFADLFSFLCGLQMYFLLLYKRVIC